MSRLSTSLFVLLAGLGAALPAVAADTHAASQATSSAKHRIVVQVSDNDQAKWNLALNNIRNVQADLGRQNVQVELVAYGPGISMLKAESVVGNRIAEALGAGVQVVACQNTMRGQKLTEADMLPKIGYVPAGVTEILLKQQQGWAYLRP